MPVGTGREGSGSPLEGRLSALDRVLPAALRDAEPALRWRARVVVVAAGAAGCCLPLAAAYVGVAGSPELAIVLGAYALALVLVPVAMFSSGSVATAGNLVLAILLSLVLIGPAANWGIAAPSLLWLTLLPIGGYLFGGPRSGALWVGLSMATVVGLFAHSQLLDAPPSLPTEQRSAYPAMRTINLLAVLVVVSAVTRRALRDREQALERMTAARDEAEAANEAKGRFLAAMSHEIRTPLAGVLGAAELLATSTLGAEQRRLVGTIQRSGSSLMTLLDDVLDYSRVEAGRARLRIGEVDPRALAREVNEVLGQLARTKGLELELAIAPDVPRRVRSDGTRLRQILVNLVGNAIKFTERGRVEIAVSAAARGEAGTRLRFDVRDTGIGIDPEQLESVFERFTQVDDSNTRTRGGAGLGLAIARQLAELLGGEIRAESAPGRGSRFWLELPVDGVVPALPEPARDPRRERAVPVRASAPGQVLLAEDDPVNQQVLVGMLEKLGHRVRVVADGREVLSVLETERFELLLLDCHMPGLDGYEAARALRERERGGEGLPGARLPVVALTASALEGERERCLAAGMDDHVAKPVSLAALSAMLECWLPVEPARPRLDPDVVGELRALDRQGEGGLLGRVAKTFEETAPRRIAALEEAARTGDAHALAEQAHALKSSCASLGATELAEICVRLESEGRAGSVAGAGEPIEALRVGLGRVLEEIAGWS